MMLIDDVFDNRIQYLTYTQQIVLESVEMVQLCIMTLKQLRINANKTLVCKRKTDGGQGRKRRDLRIER